MTGARRISPEHCLQKHVRLWVREAVAAPHVFLAFDRAAPTGQWTHARERARGVAPGTPDTLLRVKGLAPIWCELKAPGAKPSEHQLRMGGILESVGDDWFVARSCVEYRAALVEIGVPLAQNAEFLALFRDAAVEKEIVRARGRQWSPRAGKGGGPRATPSQVARARTAGVLV